MQIEIKDTTHGPVYLQIRAQIEAHISAGRFAAGEKLPAPAELAARLGVDSGEVQRAYYELEQSGKIEKRTSKDFLGKSKISYFARGK